MELSEEELRRICGFSFDAENVELLRSRVKMQTMLHEFNHSLPVEIEKRERIIRELFGAFGKESHIEPPFFCDCGRKIFVGDYTFMNSGITILDNAEVRIGSHCWLAPSVQIYASTHPTDYLERRERCLSFPVEIGDDVWLGGAVVVCPGVKIGPRSVIGAGSVVVKDIPADSLAVGNPCRVVKKLNQAGGSQAK